MRALSVSECKYVSGGDNETTYTSNQIVGMFGDSAFPTGISVTMPEIVVTADKLPTITAADYAELGLGLIILGGFAIALAPAAGAVGATVAGVQLASAGLTAAGNISLVGGGLIAASAFGATFMNSTPAPKKGTQNP